MIDTTNHTPRALVYVRATLTLYGLLERPGLMCTYVRLVWFLRPRPLVRPHVSDVKVHVSQMRNDNKLHIHIH